MMKFLVIASTIAVVAAAIVLCVYRLRKNPSSGKWLPLEIVVGVLLGLLVFFIGEKLFAHV